MKKNILLLTIFFTSISVGQTEIPKELTKFIPKGYFISEKIKGDLNKDGIEDLVLIIKGTDKSKIVIDEYYKSKLDRNRRGIIILFNLNGHYELAAKNLNCFSSENEDGGNYMPPELGIFIERGNLCVHYGHGRYGYWRYIFRFQNSDFELIGYESSDNFGPIVDTQTSINYLTKKKIKRENINRYKEGAKEVFKETSKKINSKELYKLTKIEDFDEFESVDN